MLASSQQEAIAESLKEVQKIRWNRRDTTITLGGDFDFKDIDWNIESVPPGSYKSTASQNLLDTLQNHHLLQMQKEPTQQDSVLDPWPLHHKQTIACEDHYNHP